MPSGRTSSRSHAVDVLPPPPPPQRVRSSISGHVYVSSGVCRIVPVMPALPAAPGVVRVALSGTINTVAPWLTRFFIHYTGTAPTVANLATYNASIATAYTTSLKALADTVTVLTQVECIDLTSSTGAVAITPESITGTRSGAVLPADACTVASYQLARRYRGGHPRGYWRFGTATDTASAQAWGASFITTVNTDLNAFIASLVGAGWSGAGTLTQVNVSYYSGFTVVTNPITGRARNVPTLRVAPVVDAITAIAGKTSIGSQRRRIQFFD